MNSGLDQGLDNTLDNDGFGSDSAAIFGNVNNDDIDTAFEEDDDELDEGAIF